MHCRFFLIILLSFIILACDDTPPPERKSVEQLGLEAEHKIFRFAGKPFPLGLDWLNVSRPLTLEDIKGRIVILDFWTYGCINCFHANAKLKKIKQQYQDKVLIISVHVPKFENEKNLKTLAKNLIRYEMHHPVLNDIDRQLAKAYQVKAWPSFVILDKQARIVGKTVGESRVWLIKKAIVKLMTEEEDNPEPSPIPLFLEKNKTSDLLLSPSKIAINKAFVAISDSLHHRIILASHAGKILQIYGTGQAGFIDGSPNKVQFNQPQGLAFADNGLYIADSANHRLRFINFKTQQTLTVAGGGQSMDLLYPFDPPMDAKTTALSSPFDLVVKDEDLYIAMAGRHQIWKFHRPSHKINIYAGASGEGIKDGDIDKATFSQPMGLSLFNHLLWVADAESSSIRQINLKTKKVTTLIGTGLFYFGDQDGAFKQAKLQHLSAIKPLNKNKLLIADTYNHKIKLADLKTQQIETLIDQPILNEPADIVVMDQTLLIVDTNHNRIMQYWFKTKKLIPWRLFE